jgi:hypothetical protein
MHGLLHLHILVTAPLGTALNRGVKLRTTKHELWAVPCWEVHTAGGAVCTTALALIGHLLFRPWYDWCNQAD